MAPEQWVSGDLVTRQCDIYALGILAYEAIAGRRPFSGGFEDLARQHLLAPVPPLPASLPSDLNAVLARAMAKDAVDRPRSALEFAREFRRASGIGADAAELPRRLALTPPRSRSRSTRSRLAEAVAELSGARGAYQALDAALPDPRVWPRDCSR